MEIFEKIQDTADLKRALLYPDPPEEGDETPDPVKTFFDKGSDRSRIRQLAWLVSEIEAEEETYRSLASKFAAKAAACEAASRSVRNGIRDWMVEEGVREVDLEDRFVELRTNGGLQPVEIQPDLDLQTVPPEFVKTSLSLDTQTVRQSLTAGRELPFARLLPRGVHVRIR